MTELSPRLTYSPEGILEVRRRFNNGDNEIFMAHIALQKAQLLEQAGWVVADDGTETTLRVDVPRVLRPSKKSDNSSMDFNAAKLVHDLSPFMGISGYVDEKSDEYIIEPTDNVFSLDSLYTQGAVGVVYPQFQRWLNAGGLDEPAAKACLEALAVPFGTEGRRGLKKDLSFGYRTDGKSAQLGVGDFGFSVTSHYADFGINRREDSDESPEYKRGEVKWNWLGVSTIGSCACWGVDGDERERVYVSSRSTRLYLMYNIDISTQSISLVLGVSALAYTASKYEGTEDILANVEWQK